MKNMLQARCVAWTALLALAGCGGGESGESASSSAAGGGGSALSGCYVGDVEGAGMTMEFDFRTDGNALLTFSEGGNRLDPMECTYQSGEARIAVSCFGSSGISLTRLEGGDLEGDLDGAIVRFRKC